MYRFFPDMDHLAVSPTVDVRGHLSCRLQGYEGNSLLCFDTKSCKNFIWDFRLGVDDGYYEPWPKFHPIRKPSGERAYRWIRSNAGAVKYITKTCGNNRVGLRLRDLAIKGADYQDLDQHQKSLLIELDKAILESTAPKLCERADKWDLSVITTLGNHSLAGGNIQKHLENFCSFPRDYKFERNANNGVTIYRKDSKAEICLEQFLEIIVPKEGGEVTGRRRKRKNPESRSA